MLSGGFDVLVAPPTMPSSNPAGSTVCLIYFSVVGFELEVALTVHEVCVQYQMHLRLD